MIYFDNAATTKDKPEEVFQAFEYYVKEIGVSPSRGSYQLGIEASRLLYKTRKVVGKYFDSTIPEQVIFTKNSTEAINMFFNGFLEKGDHVIISCYEHNAVLRPIHLLFQKGIVEYSIISREDLLLSPSEIYGKYAKTNTKLICMTLASNLTGRIVFNPEVFKYFKDKMVFTFLDSSQGAGKVKISMRNDNIDYLAFTGHKDLMALPGVGGLCCNDGIKFLPLIQGGTGVYGDEYINPNIFPEGFEAGTLNMPAIWSLNEAINSLCNNYNKILITEKQLMSYLIEKLKELDNIILYDLEYPRVSTCCINVKQMMSNEVVELLDKKSICVRGGIHCSILAHESLKTVNSGAVRISISSYNNKDEIDTLIDILKECR